MELFKKGSVYTGIVVVLFSIGCASSGDTRGSVTVKKGVGSQVENPTVSLADYLRREAGVTVQGSGSNARVLVRGVRSVHGNNQPLFVIDGSRVGRSLSQVATMISVNDIDKIEVLKGNEASSRYGMEGSAGVILIRTRKG